MLALSSGSSCFDLLSVGMTGVVPTPRNNEHLNSDINECHSIDGLDSIFYSNGVSFIDGMFKVFPE